MEQIRGTPPPPPTWPAFTSDNSQGGEQQLRSTLPSFTAAAAVSSLQGSSAGLLYNDAANPLPTADYHAAEEEGGKMAAEIEANVEALHRGKETHTAAAAAAEGE